MAMAVAHGDSFRANECLSPPCVQRRCRQIPRDDDGEDPDGMGVSIDLDYLAGEEDDDEQQVGGGGGVIDMRMGIVLCVCTAVSRCTHVYVCMCESTWRRIQVSCVCMHCVHCVMCTCSYGVLRSVHTHTTTLEGETGRGR